MVTELDVDGRVDEKDPGITYWGKATLQENGEWACYANVHGALCIVEVKITGLPSSKIQFRRAVEV